MAQGNSLSGAGEAPEIETGLLFVWSAFWELSTERQIGMGLGPIPHSAIQSFARDHQVVGDHLDSLKVIIRAVDAEYLRLLAPKNPKQPNTVRGDDIEGVKNVLSRAAKRPSE